MKKNISQHLDALEKAIDEIPNEDLVKLVRSSKLSEQQAAYYAVVETVILGCTSYQGPELSPLIVSAVNDDLAKAA